MANGMDATERRSWNWAYNAIDTAHSKVLEAAGEIDGYDKDLLAKANIIAELLFELRSDMAEVLNGAA